MVSKKNKGVKSQAGEGGLSELTRGTREVKNLKRTRNCRHQVSASPRFKHKIGSLSPEALEEKWEKFQTYRHQRVGTQTNTKCNDDTSSLLPQCTSRIYQQVFYPRQEAGGRFSRTVARNSYIF